jgi:hypothetical protein
MSREGTKLEFEYKKPDQGVPVNYPEYMQRLK